MDWISNELNDTLMQFLGCIRDKRDLDIEDVNRFDAGNGFLVRAWIPALEHRLVRVERDMNGYGIPIYETTHIALTDKGRMVLNVVDYRSRPIICT